MNKLKISRLMMIVTILLVVGFQGYWITRLYNDEWHNLQRESDFIFSGMSFINCNCNVLETTHQF